MEEKKIILVTGATGRQGGAVTRRLLARSWKVRALTRKPESDTAKTLLKGGVEVVRGDLGDPSSLLKASEGTYGIFSVQNYWEHGFDAEVGQGKALADAARKAGVQHFVYSSVGGANQKTGIRHFESKWLIEEHIRSTGLPATIIRPVFFMENFFGRRVSILQGVLPMPMKPEKRFSMVAANDIGGVAAKAFEEPQKFIGRSIDLASDADSMLGIAASFSRVIGRPVEYVQIDLDALRQSPGGEDRVAMFEWFNNVGYEVDIRALEEEDGIRLTRFEEWLRRTGWGG